MATLVLGVVGAVIGGAVAGPGGAAKGAMLGWSIGATIGGMIDASNMRFPPQDVGKLNDLRVTSSSYGTFIPQCWGRVRVPGQLIWSTSLEEHEEDKNQGGGKGGPSVTVRNFTYTVSLMLLLCATGRMTNSSLKKIHFDDQIVVDTDLPSSSWKIPSANVRFRSGAPTQAADALITAQYGADAPCQRGVCTLMLQDVLLTDYGNRIPNINVELDTGTVYIGDVIYDVLVQVGYDSSDIEVSDVSSGMSNVVTGMALGARTSGKSALQAALSAYQVDLVDVDGKARAVKRGGSPSFTLQRNYQGAYLLNSGSPTPRTRLTTVRKQEVELPKRVDITYLSTTNDLQSATQTAVRETVRNRNLVQISVPLTLDDNTARRVAETELYLQWLERVMYRTSTFLMFLSVAPADVGWLEIDDAGTQKRVRVVEQEIGLLGPIDMSFLPDSSDIMTQTVDGSPPPSGGTLATPVDTSFFAWSGRELRNQDGNSPGFYVAATGESGWQGCSVYYSVDGGSNWIPCGIISARSVIGVVTGTLGSVYTPNGNGFDVTNDVQIDVTEPGSMASTSEATVLAGGGNYGIILDADTSIDNSTNYEVFGFAGVTPDGGQLFTISDLLRSQRDTVATGHTSSDAFVQITPGLLRVNVNANLIGQVIKVLCVSAYQTIAGVAGNAQDVYIAQNHKPYATGDDIGDALNALPKTPFWRVRQYVHVYSTTGNLPVGLDESYFDGGGSFPVGAVQNDWNMYCAGPGGSLSYNNKGTGDHVWFRIKIKNSTGGSLSFNWRVTSWYNETRVRFDGTFIYDNGSFDTSGTQAVAAGTEKLLEIFYGNDTNSFALDNHGAVEFWMDAFDISGLSFVDAGV